MNIAFISAPYPPSSHGGIGSYVYTMAHTLIEEGHEVNVIARCNFRQDHDTWDGPVHIHWVGPVVLTPFWKRPLIWLRLYETFPHVLDWLGWSLAAALKVRNLHSKKAIDIIEAPDHMAQGFISTFLKKPTLIIRIHSPLAVNVLAKQHPIIQDQRLAFHFERWAVTRTRAITTPSHAYANFIRKFWNLGKKEISVIPNPVDTYLFRPNEEKRRKDLVTYVGRLNKAKGLLILFESIPKVLSVLPNARFCIAGFDEGDAPERGLTYELYFRRRNTEIINNKVQFISWLSRENVSELFQKSLITVTPSIGHENLSYAIVEAMSCGCAVIASSIGGIPEIIDHEETGVLVKPGEAGELASAIIQLLREPDRAISIGKRARQAVLERFDRRVIVRRMLNFYHNRLIIQ